MMTLHEKTPAGGQISSIQAAAEEYTKAGLAVCRIFAGEKRPRNPGWSTQSESPSNFTESDGIGIVYGAFSAPQGFALVGIDLDSEDAIEHAPAYLPPTQAIDGRTSKRLRHWLFNVPLTSIPSELWSTAPQAAAASTARFGHPGPRTESFRYPNRKEAFRIIGTGGQMNAPPTRHESGEVIFWEHGRNFPGIADYRVLREQCIKLATEIGANPPRTKSHASYTQTETAAKVAIDSVHADAKNKHALRNPKLLAAAVQNATAWAGHIGRNDPPRSGHGGDGKTHRILANLLFGFRLPRAVVLKVFGEEINERLKTLGDAWDIDALNRKLGILCVRGEHPDYPVGSALVSSSPALSTNDGELAFSALATLTPKPIRWLVRGRIPGGMLVMIAGDGGHGKSFITLHLAAAISTGGSPFGLENQPVEAGSVVLISCEDDWERTILPRLDALGADTTRIYRIEGIKLKDGKILDFNISHVELLRRMLAKIGDVKLVVIDPAGAFIGRTGIDEHKDAELRSLLGPLSEMANDTGATVLLVKHLNKAVGVSAVQRVGGSAGYVNAVRASYLVVPDREDTARKLFLPLKTNVLSGSVRGRAYRIAQLAESEATPMLAAKYPALPETDLTELVRQMATLKWELNDCDIDANAAANPPRSKSSEEQLTACEAFIRGFFGDYSRPVADLDTAAAATFSGRILKAAKAKLRGLPPSDPTRLSSRALTEGGPWFGWIGSPSHPRPLRPNECGAPASDVNQTAGPN